MHIEVISGQGPTASQDVAQGLLDLEVPVSFASIHLNAEQSPNAVMALDLGAVLGATSCKGAMTLAGPGQDAAALVISDPDGSYGTACRPLGASSREAARAATIAALAAADRPGEKPDLVWLASTPGTEEAVLDGIASVVGKDVPIIGGSAADNSVTGDWFVFDGATHLSEGVCVAVLFPSGPVSFAYQNGYSPAAARGQVTKADGRTLYEIDGRPAAHVIAEWTRGAVALAPEEDAQSILAASSLWPLGRKTHHVGGVPFYLLAHPATGDASTGALHLFADVSEGEILTQMEGSIDSLVARAGRVARFACQSASFDPPEVAGALMIYCGGCMLTVQDRIGDVAQGVAQELHGAPFLGAFTFGEQGPLLGAGNRHGNLMISCIIFGRNG